MSINKHCLPLILVLTSFSAIAASADQFKSIKTLKYERLETRANSDDANYQCLMQTPYSVTLDNVRLYAKTDLSKCAAIIEKPKGLTLNDVLQKTLIKSPELAEAFYSISETQAKVDLAIAAFRPEISINGELSAEHTPSTYDGTGTKYASVNGSLNLTWVLFDFGAISANLAAARSQLNSILATKENTALATLIESLRIYTEALTAYVRLNTLLESERTAYKSMEISQALFDAKTVGLTEKLQAQTALNQASFDRTIAQGNWNVAKGKLAVVMGLPVDSPIIMADIESSFPVLSSPPQINSLLDDIKKSHPSIRSLVSEIESLQSRLKSIKAEDKGTLNLAISGGTTRTYFDTGQSDFGSDLNLALQAKIPLFSGEFKSAREAEVSAQISRTESRIVKTQNELVNEVWQNVQQIATETENLTNSKKLLESAKQNYQVSLGRYKAGITEVSELLRAQTTLTNAQQQLDSVKIRYIQSQIRLSLVSGKLSVLY